MADGYEAVYARMLGLEVEADEHEGGRDDKVLEMTAGRRGPRPETDAATSA